jgi:hypothetical protein
LIVASARLSFEFHAFAWAIQEASAPVMSNDDGRTPVHVLIMRLAGLATKNPSENEAVSAAMKACRLLQENPHLLNDTRDPGPTDADDPFWVPANVPASTKSEIHPRAREYREWAAFLHKHRISEETSAGNDGLCLSCGKVYGPDDAVFHHKKLGATHRGCGSWWRSYDYSGVESTSGSEPFGDDEIPF